MRLCYHVFALWSGCVSVLRASGNTASNEQVRWLHTILCYGIPFHSRRQVTYLVYHSNSRAASLFLSPKRVAKFSSGSYVFKVKQLGFKKLYPKAEVSHIGNLHRYLIVLVPEKLALRNENDVEAMRAVLKDPRTLTITVADEFCRSALAIVFWGIPTAPTEQVYPATGIPFALNEVLRAGRQLV